MTAKDNSVFATLSDASWRGIVFPLLSRDMRFGISQAKYPILYRTELHESLLTTARVFHYQIPASNSLFREPYVNWFSSKYKAFYQAFHGDRSPGELADPIHGTFQALPLEWDERATTEDRNGVALSVSFVEYISPATIDDEHSGALLEDAAVYAGTLDDEIAKQPNTTLSKLPDYPPRVSFSEAISRIKGVGDRLIRGGQRQVAMLHDIAGRCEALVRTIDQLLNPGETIGIRVAAQRLHRSVVELAKRTANPIKMVQTITVNSAKTVSVLAADAGMAVADFLALNPSLQGKTRVPSGTRAKIHRKVSQG